MRQLRPVLPVTDYESHRPARGLRSWYNSDVNVIVDYLEGGETLEEFLKGFPTVTREFVVAALEEAKGLLLARS